MITITKGRLLTIKQWRETYGPGSNVVLPAEEAEELARIALVSLEAELMAKIIAHYPLGVDVGKQKFVQAIGELPDFGGYLFAAPPAASSAGRSNSGKRRNALWLCFHVQINR
ncbi:hypothetical protein AB2F06_13220 [Escherichia coli]